MKVSYIQCDICKEQISDSIRFSSYRIDGDGMHKSIDLCPTCRNTFLNTLEKLFERDLYKDLDILHLDLSVHAYNCLKRVGITTVGDLADKYTYPDLLSIKTLGRRCSQEIVDALYEKCQITLLGTPEREVSTNE